MNRLQEIEVRLQEIKTDIEKRGDQLTADEVNAYETETNQLKEERAALQAAAEKRQQILDGLANGTAGTVTNTFSGPSPSAPAGGEQRSNSDPLESMEYRSAFMKYVLKGESIPAEYREAQVSKTTDVGATIPTTVLNRIVEKMESTGMILSRVTRTAYKGGVGIPVSSVKPTATWVNEGAGSDTQKHDIKSSGMIVFNYHKLRCAVAVSLEVDTMAIAAFETMLVNNIVEAMTKAIEQAIVSGDGSGKPKGIIKETPADGQAIESAAPGYADLIAAEAALPLAYENDAVWCMSKKTFMQYYGLVDETGQPLGRVNYGLAGKPERFLLGRPVVVCDYLPSFTSAISTGEVFAFLFNFKDYILNTNYAMGLKKYENNATDDIVTKAIMIVDGKVVDKNSLVVIKKSA